MSSIESFLEYDARIHMRTRKVIECVPRDRIEWSCAPGKFTLGDLIRHLAAMERYMWAETVQGRPSCYPGHERTLADGYDAVVRYFLDRHAESTEIFSRLTPGDLGRTCRTPGNAEIPVWKWLRAKIEHEIHHRGQLYVYLSILQVPTPPIFGLTSEEVRQHGMSS